MGNGVPSLWQLPFERAVQAAAEAIIAGSKRVVSVRGRTVYEKRIDLYRGWISRDSTLGRLIECRIRVRITVEVDPFGAKQED